MDGVGGGQATAAAQHGHCEAARLPTIACLICRSRFPICALACALVCQASAGSDDSETTLVMGGGGGGFATGRDAAAARAESEARASFPPPPTQPHHHAYSPIDGCIAHVMLPLSSCYG